MMKNIILLTCLLPLLSGCWEEEDIKRQIKADKPDAVFWENTSSDIVYNAQSADGKECEFRRVMWGHDKGIIRDEVLGTKHVQFCETGKALEEKVRQLSELQEEFDRFKHAVCPGGPETCFYQ